MTDDDIAQLAYALYPVARNSGKDRAFRKLIAHAIKEAHDDDPAIADDAVRPSNTASDCLLRLMEVWDELRRDEFHDWDELADRVTATIYERGQPSDEGIPNIWIRIPGRQACFFTECADVDIDVWLTVGSQKYNAKLRHVSANRYLHIYPALKTLDGEDTRLGKVLLEAGYSVDDPIELFVHETSIRVNTLA